jgi:hypothetical protein
MVESRLVPLEGSGRERGDLRNGEGRGVMEGMRKGLYRLRVRY